MATISEREPLRGREAIGRAIAAEMAERGMNAVELSELSGVNSRTVRSALNGDRTLRTASSTAIARALGWEPDWWQLLTEGFTLRELRLVRGDALTSNLTLRDPHSITLGEATTAELLAALARATGVG